MTQPLLALQELSKYYVNGQNVVAGLNKISLSFEKGEFVAITGESGSGKSSLAHILGGILPYEDGEMFIEGAPTSHYDSVDWERYRAGSVGFISQSYGILPGATVEENVISALRLTGMTRRTAVSEARRILEEVELWGMRTRRAAKLSSGQKQRLSIARALAKPCSVLIADEPTGNLDPENSEKGIKLLARAARDRRVILITHEFSEAEDYVTRHISLQDGRVCADARLRDFTLQEQPAPPRRRTRGLGGYIARLQIKSRPAWSTIMLLFMVLTAFAVFAFLGSFIVALDDTSTRIYDSEAFLNGDKCRIVAVRSDGESMTQADYDTILAIPNVARLEKFGYITDLCYAYREDDDYRINVSRHNYGSIESPEYMLLDSVSVHSTEQYMQSVPLFADDTEFLTAGRLPQAFDEVVAADAALLGKSFPVYLRSINDWALGGLIEIEVTVVGLTDFGSGLYFHDDVGRTLTLDYLGADYTYIPYTGEVPDSASYINYRDARSKMRFGPMCPPFYAVVKPAEDSDMRPLADNEALISMTAYIDILEETPAADYRSIYAMGFASDAGSWRTAGIHSSTLENVVAVSPAAFERVLEESGVGNGDQVSITITDYAYTERVIEQLKQAGYYALSPFVLGSAQIDEELAAQRLQSLVICMGALCFILLLQLIVLRAMFGMENESYRVLSDMGLTCRTAQRSVFWQVLIFTLAGQIVGLLGIALCSYLGIERITELTKYLYGWWWLAISGIHLLSTMLAAWLIASSLKKTVYPRTVRVRDLIIDDEEAAK